MKQTVLPVGGHALPTWGSPGTSLGHLREVPHIGPPAGGTAHSETLCGHCSTRACRTTVGESVVLWINWPAG